MDEKLQEIIRHSNYAQVGFVVNNLEEAKTNFARLFGVEVPATVGAGEYEVTKTKIFGRPAPEADCKMAFFDLVPGVQLELIEPNEVSSVWRDWIREHGEGIHHIAFQVDDAGKTAKELEEAFGAKVEQEGNYGDASGRYIYLDCFEKLKCRIELLESFHR